MEEWWATRDGRRGHFLATMATARTEDPLAHHKWVYCTVCDKTYVTRRGAVGCSCGRITLIPVTSDSAETIRTMRPKGAYHCGVTF